MANDYGYKKFWGNRPQKRTKGKFHVPKQLVFIGRANKIEYISDKKHGGGDGKTAIYVHKFETPVSLYMDETNKKQLYLIGTRLKVTKNGIEN